MTSKRFNINKGLLAIGRLAGLGLFTWFLMDNLTFQMSRVMTAEQFFQDGLWRLTALDEFGHPYFSMVKLLICCSLFGLGFLQTISFTSELSENFHHVVKFHCKSLSDYLYQRFLYSCRFYGKDGLAWLLVIGVLYWQTKDTIFFGFLLEFLVVNFLGALLLSLIVPNAMISLIGFALLFLCQEWLFINIYWTIPIFLGIIFLLLVTPLGSRLRGDES